MKTVSFNFESPSGKDQAVKEVVRTFARAGAKVITAEVDKNTSRRAGVTFRTLNLVFVDGQKVAMSFKATGDVFEIRVNDKAVPLRDQDDHIGTISEVVGRLDAGRANYQKALARVRVPLPPSVRTSRTQMRLAKVQKRDALVEAVAAARLILSGLTEAVAGT